MTDFIRDVLEFHEAFGCAIGERPNPMQPFANREAIGAAMGHLMSAKALLRDAAAKSSSILSSRLACAVEELIEQIQAHLDGDSEALLDALVDRMYFIASDVVAFGFHTDASSHGNRFGRAWARVHAANMAKRLPDGTVLRDETGKVIKPPGWVAPDLSDLVV